MISSPLRHGVYVRQRKRLDSGGEEDRLLLSRLDQREMCVRHHERKRNTWKSSTGPSVGDMFGASEQAPWQYGVENVLDRSLAEIQDTGQVEMLVRRRDQFQMTGRTGNALIAMGQIGRQ